MSAPKGKHENVLVNINAIMESELIHTSCPNYFSAQQLNKRWAPYFPVSGLLKTNEMKATHCRTEVLAINMHIMYYAIVKEF